MSVGRVAKRAASLIHRFRINDHDRLQRLSAAITAGCRAIDVTEGADEVFADFSKRAQESPDGFPRSNQWLQATVSPSVSEHKPLGHGNRTLTDLLRPAMNGNTYNSEKPEITYLDSAFIDLGNIDLHETVEAYKTLFAFHSDDASKSGVRSLGVSNVTREQIENIHGDMKINPSVVCNAFTADTGYDDKLRSFCKDKGIAYQCHNIVTGNDHLLQSAAVQELAANADIVPVSALHAHIVLGLNISTIVNDIIDDQDTGSLLGALAKVRLWKDRNRNKWMSLVSSFKGSLSRGRVL